MPVGLKVQVIGPYLYHLQYGGQRKKETKMDKCHQQPFSLKPNTKHIPQETCTLEDYVPRILRWILAGVTKLSLFDKPSTDARTKARVYAAQYTAPSFNHFLFLVYIFLQVTILIYFVLWFFSLTLLTHNASVGYSSSLKNAACSRLN